MNSGFFKHDAAEFKEDLGEVERDKKQ